MRMSIQHYALTSLASSKECLMRESLWCVHIPERSDFIAMPSEEAARQEALAINAAMKDGSERRSQSDHALAIRWPFSLSSHERALGEDWDDLRRMPHRKSIARRRESGVSSLARWIMIGLCKLQTRGRKR